jgi:enamine deaminase RidA (YjgF/YER057c/UK114 family)
MRTSVGSGTIWEGIAGYSRATRVGNHIWTAGTTATADNGSVVAPGDPGAQTHFCILKIERALKQLGASLNDVVRTRVYVSDVNNWEPIARAHGEVFGEIRPANTMVQASLIGDGYLVEVEAEAVIDA